MAPESIVFFILRTNSQVSKMNLQSERRLNLIGYYRSKAIKINSLSGVKVVNISC